MRRGGLLAVAFLVACVGSTGSDLVTFGAAAAGPADARGGPYTFETGRGFIVTLTRAKIHIGALYLNAGAPISGGPEIPCTLPGRYVGQVLNDPDAAEVDILSGTPQPFPARGTGTADLAETGEVWLVRGDVNADTDIAPQTILDLAGTATKAGTAYPFEARLTIGTNRAVQPTDPARPGANPICEQRIVTSIPVSLTPRKTGTLLVRVDPRGFFGNVAFDDLERVSDSTPLYRFADTSNGQSNANLYAGLRSTASYRFVWMD